MILLENLIEDVSETVPEVTKVTFWTKFIGYAEKTIFPIIIKIAISIVVLILGRLLIKCIVKLVKKVFKRTKLDEAVESFLASIIKALLYIGLIVIIVEILGVGTATIISVIGSAGLAVGLALQGSLSNFAGGVLILILKPFRLGDYISASGQDGTVVSIDIFYTKLRTADFKDVVIPNGTLSNSCITNYSAQNKRRMDIVAPAAYGADMNKVKEVLMSIAKNSELVMQDEPISVFVDEYAGSSVNYDLRFWVKAENYWGAKFAITDSIKQEFDKNGIEIPFTQVDVTVKHIEK